MNRHLGFGIVADGAVRILRAAVRGYPANNVFVDALEARQSRRPPGRSADTGGLPPKLGEDLREKECGQLSGRGFLDSVGSASAARPGLPGKVPGEPGLPEPEPVSALPTVPPMSPRAGHARPRGADEPHMPEQRFSLPGGAPKSLRGVAFSADSSLLVSWGRDGTARLWDVGTGGGGHLPNDSLRLFSHPEPVRRAAFSPDRRLLATVCADDRKDVPGEVWLWDVASGRRSHVRPHRTVPSSLVFSPDGSHVVTGGSGEVWLWDVADGTSAGPRVLGGPESVVEVSADARLVAVAELGSSEVAVADVAGADVPRRISARAAISKIKFSSDGRLLAILNQGGVLRLWVPLTATVCHTSEGGPAVLGFALSPDGRLLATRHEDGRDGRRYLQPQYVQRRYTVRVTDLEARRTRWSFPHTRDPRMLVFGPDGSFLVAYNQGHQDVYLHELGMPAADAGRLRHAELVSAVAVSPDGRRLAAATDAGSIALWDLRPVTGQ
jgi:WD40 repeat protein